ncbi:MAG: nucleotidyltransferase domain-containing protein [Candidatus Parcubacteria bacterium]|nr:nucleotidyltransferase domain-containing protein [Candidatus Parcubacteria bacterium]
MSKFLGKQKQLRRIFSRYPEIKLAYLFGSQAKGEANQLSDYDFAFYAVADVRRMNDIKLSLIGDLSEFLKSNKIDVVVLNSSLGPEFKYQVIKNSSLIYEKEPYKLLVEPAIYNAFFDFRETLIRNGLGMAYKKQK